MGRLQRAPQQMCTQHFWRACSGFWGEWFGVLILWRFGLPDQVFFYFIFSPFLLPFLVCFWIRVCLCNPDCYGTDCVPQVGLGFLRLYTHELSHPAPTYISCSLLVAFVLERCLPLPHRSLLPLSAIFVHVQGMAFPISRSSWNFMVQI